MKRTMPGFFPYVSHDDGYHFTIFKRRSFKEVLDPAKRAAHKDQWLFRKPDDWVQKIKRPP
ncbi:MAG: hypothetical protein RQM92_04730 [Candidatus Syntrophopropionicum ammoniitolerans]